MYRYKTITYCIYILYPKLTSANQIIVPTQY